MKGFSRYTQNEPPPDVQIKADWGQGVNTVLPADRLPPMQFTHGMNIELREGYPVTRTGVGRANWLYRNGVKLGEVFQGYGLIQGADPDPVLRLPLANLVVCDNDLWLCAPNNEPTLLMEDCTDALQEVEIIDAFDEALILRNLNQPPLRYRYEPGRFPEALPAARPGQTALPNARTGCYAANRVWLVLGKSEVVASDIFEWDYNTTETRWQVDDGEGDEIVRLWPVGENRIVVFKTRSVHVIEGTAALDTVSDPPVQVNIYRVAAARGCVAPHAIAQRGQTLFYLGRDGLEALVLSESAVTAMSDKPLSLAVDRYWKGLRWLDVAGARMTIARGHLLISVPTRYREDESIPSLLLGGAFTEEPPPPYEPPEEEVCDLTFVTYSGSGTWCGFEAFFTNTPGMTKRYLTKTVKGFQQYVNGYFYTPQYTNWMDEKPEILANIRALLAGDDPWTVADIPPPEDIPLRSGFQFLPAIESAWYGQAAYDPSDGCALANDIHVYRRTNGWQYANVMQFSTGSPTSDEVVADPDALFVGPYPGALQEIVGYNTEFAESETHKLYSSNGLTILGNQLGSHTNFGYVKEILGDEHTLFDQLVIDGAVVTTTRSSELFSYNDDTGVFDGKISAFTFDVGLTLNVENVKYAVEFVVRRTTGAESELETVSVEYTGDGSSSRTLTIEVPVSLPGTLTEFQGECVTVRRSSYYYDDFQRIDVDEWTMGPVQGWEKWSQAGWIGCGTPSTISVDSFTDAAISIDGQNIIDEPQDTGHCWGGAWWHPTSGEPVCWDDYAGKTTDSSVVIWEGGIGWSRLGWFGVAENTRSFDDYEDQTAGTITTWETGTGWGGFGWFGDDGQLISLDDYESQSAGTITTWTSGTGWDGDGWFGLTV